MTFDSFDILKVPLNGTNLIEASAGTGKTYTIAGLYLRLIVEKRFTVDQILVVTFTKAATEELKQRIRTRLTEARQAFISKGSDDALLGRLVLQSQNPEMSLARLSDAIRDFDACAIFTIHGFCQRILHENAFETGNLFDTDLVPDQRDLLIPICEDFWRQTLYEAPPEFTRYALLKLRGPEAFFRLLNTSKDPGLRVIPNLERPSLPSLDAFRNCCRSTRKVWPEVRNAVERHLMDPALNGTVYGSFKPEKHHPDKTLREARVDHLMAAMDAFCDHAALQFPLFAEIDKFCSTYIAAKTRKGKAAPAHWFFDHCDALNTFGQSLLLEVRSLLLFVKTDLFRFAREKLPLLKKEQNIQHFDDLLTRVSDALSKPGGDLLSSTVKRRFRAALVDEFQDTDMLQYTIFSRLFAGNNSLFFMIGDPKQAIYGFRGADIFSYMRAASRADRRYTLKTNYRSRAPLIAAVNTLFSRVAKPFVFSDIPFVEGLAAEDDSPERQRGKSAFEIWFAGSANGKPMNKGDAETIISRTVADTIRRIISGDDAVDPGNIAVLVRTNRQAELVKKDLSIKRVPAVIYSAGNVFATREARDLFLLMTSIAQPSDQGRFRAALATSIMGVPFDRLDLQEDADVWQEPLLNRFEDYHQMWLRHGFVQMFNQVMAREHVRARLLRMVDGERRLTNLLHLAELLHASAVNSSLGIPALIKWFSAQRDPSSGNPETHQLRLESDAMAAKIITIHKSKGLEFPIVFCPFAWGSSIVTGEGFTFHDPDSEQRLTLDLGSPGMEDNRARAQYELLAENLRLLYVALTRARERCVLVWGRINTVETSALAYLLHYQDEGGRQPADLLQEIQFQFRSKDDTALMHDLISLETASDRSIRALPLPETTPSVRQPSEGGPHGAAELSVRNIEKPVARDWQVYSYSSLVAHRPALIPGGEGVAADGRGRIRAYSIEEPAGQDHPDRDEVTLFDGPGDTGHQDGESSGERSIFTFAKGAQAGIFFHDLFEHLDFSAIDDRLLRPYVAEQFKTYGIDPVWQPPVRQMIEKVLTTPLTAADDTFTLGMLANRQRINEMEFYFPLRKFSADRLQEAFAIHGKSSRLTGMPEQMGRLHFSPARGFMKGYIDMVFEANNRYYIVDWKSNHLGYTLDDYRPGRLDAVMQRSFYTLQYHIYTLALHLYLKLRRPEYRFAKHFGGVFYLFIRGIDPKKGDGCGVYYDRPAETLVDALEHVMLPGALRRRHPRQA